MRILVLNADYPRFLSWLYRRQPGLGSAGYAAQMAARNASLFGVADFYSRNFSALGHAAAEMHVNNAWLQTAWAREHGMAVEAAGPAAPSGSTALPGWLQRAVTPLKPMLRPLARKVGLSPSLDAQAEKILLAQIEDFKPDLVLNQDTFHVDPRLMRRIKAIGNPILIGQVGIAPSRGVDWSVYDLMMSQLSATVEFFRRLGVRAEVNHLAFEPGHSRRAAAGAGDRHRCFLCRHRVAGSPAADRAARGRRRTLRSQTVRQSAADAARRLAAASLLSGRSLGRRDVSGAAAFEDHAQFPHRHGRAGSRKHAAVRGDRRRRVSC